MSLLKKKITDVQERARAEVLNLLDESGDEQLSFSHYNELHYMEQIFNEVLRLWPGVHIVRRCASEPFQLPGKI